MIDAIVGWIAPLLFVGAVIWLLMSSGRLWRKYSAGIVTVFEHEAGLRYERGRFTGVLSAGRYPTWPSLVTIEKVDLREQTFDVPGQEILTSDAMPLRVSATIMWRIVDPARYKQASSAPVLHIYAVVQVLLRRRISELTLDALLADRAVIDRDFAAAIGAELASFGIEITKAAVKDLNLFGAAKQAFADLWKAQKEGQAALERARGEQASLRALANAARMLKGNPELMNLRLLQALGGKPGQAPPTIVLGGGGGLLPIAPGVDEPAGDAGA